MFLEVHTAPTFDSVELRAFIRKSSDILYFINIGKLIISDSYSFAQMTPLSKYVSYVINCC